MSVHERKEGESFEEWLLVELNQAYLEARRGKRKTLGESQFEVNEIENLINLKDAIINRTFEPGRGTAFVSKKPVFREIFTAPFRDRIVHHFLVNVSEEFWDKHLIHDTYACRAEKGTWFGIRRAEKNIRRVSNNFTKEAFVIKLDVQAYFVSLSRKKVFGKVLWGLQKQFPNGGELFRTAKFLWEKIIFDDPVEGVTRKGSPRDWRKIPKSKSLFFQPKGIGLVVGNLTSQFAANIFLDDLDRFITDELGYKNYGRFVDDFYIIVLKEELEKAKNDVTKIEAFLKSMGLTLHPRKKYIQNIRKGLPFLGAVIYPGRVVPGKRAKAGFKQAVQEVSAGEKSEQSVLSYLGFMKNLNGRKATKKIFLEVGWDYEI